MTDLDRLRLDHAALGLRLREAEADCARCLRRLALIRADVRRVEARLAELSAAVLAEVG